MKYLKLYEELEGFEETWIDDESPIDEKYRKHKIPKILVDFLKNENILDKFIINFERQHPKENFYEFFCNPRIEDFIRLSKLINYAFFWGYTPEGTSFWTKISRKWQNIPGLNRKVRNLKSNELYESLDDFEEVWEEEPDLEIDLSKIIFGDDGPEFKVKDKVIYTIGDYEHIGYIVTYDIFEKQYLVYFPEEYGHFDGHNASHKYGDLHRRGWWIYTRNLKKII